MIAHKSDNLSNIRSTNFEQDICQGIQSLSLILSSKEHVTEEIEDT